MAKYKLDDTEVIPTEVADEVAINPRTEIDEKEEDKFAQKTFDSVDDMEMKINNVKNKESASKNGHCNCRNIIHSKSRPKQSFRSQSLKLKSTCVDNNVKCTGCIDMHQPMNNSAKSVSGILHNGTRRFNNIHSTDCKKNTETNEKCRSTSICMGTCMTEFDFNATSFDGQGSNENVSRSLTSRIRRLCTLKMLKKRVPIITWLPKYTPQAAVSDLIAGVTVGLTVIPQAIAYANVAGLPPQYGLYSSFMACFVYTIFGSCKDSPIGPTAIAAILTRENLHELGPEFAVLLCFLSGCVELLMGILQLGFLIDFISGPVSAGFTSAAAIIIATTQLKDVLGLSFPGGKFLQVWEGLFAHIGETRLWDALLGISCIVVLLGLRKIKDILPPENNEIEETAPKQSIMSKILWFLATSRNILVVVVCAAIAYYFELHNQSPFVLTGHVKPGLPNITLPPFESEVNNKTYNFIDMASSMSSAIFVVPLLSILENIALAKVFSEGKPVDATQEMLAIGLCNIASSFVSSMPVSGALSRGAVNNASGVKTTFGGVYTGILVIVSLQFFTPYFYYIPKASLAAVIIAAVIFMVELHVFKPIWRTKKIDLIPAIATFISCLVIRLELGILIGISINLLFLLYASARPSVHISKTVSLPSGVEYLVITPDRSLVFPSVEYVRGVVSKAGIRQALSKMPVVLDATHIQCIDFTAAKGIKTLIDDYHARGQPIIFYNLKPSIVEIFQRLRPRNFKYCRCPASLDSMLQEASPDSSLTKF